MSDTRSPAEVITPGSAIAPIVVPEPERDASANSHAVVLCELSQSLVLVPHLRQSAPRVPGFAGVIAANLEIDSCGSRARTVTARSSCKTATCR